MNKNGILLINKSSNITSNKTLQLIKNNFKIKKLGHCGTLDPSASGLLIIFIGDHIKNINNIILYKKTYIITALTGVKSKSSDLDGKIIFFQRKKNYIKTENIIKNICKIQTTNSQLPSNFSSIKHHGIKLYHFARLDINIKTKKRNIIIYNITIIKNIKTLITFKIKCSHGVYIRSIIDTLSDYIKVPLCTLKIERIAIQTYTILKSYTIPELTKNKTTIINILKQFYNNN